MPFNTFRGANVGTRKPKYLLSLGLWFISGVSFADNLNAEKINSISIQLKENAIISCDASLAALEQSDEDPVLRFLQNLFGYQPNAAARQRCVKEEFSGKKYLWIEENSATDQTYRLLANQLAIDNSGSEIDLLKGITAITAEPMTKQQGNDVDIQNETTPHLKGYFVIKETIK